MHSSSMGEIHEFIFERAYEDAAVARGSFDRRGPEDHGLGDSSVLGRDPDWGPRRVLKECEIKSEIVRSHDDGACPQCMVSPEHGCETIRLLARVWSDHPDYRSDWSSFHDGDAQISPSRATEIVNELSHSAAVLQLSDREMQVLLLIAEGLGYRAIGTQLYVSVNTVKNHARNSLQKSQLHRRWGDWPGPAS